MKVNSLMALWFKSMIVRLSWSVAISLILFTPLQSQAKKAFFHFETASLRQGLSNLWVIKVLQGPQGYIWVATQNGLYRFDGYQFKTFSYNPADPASLPGNYVQDLYLDSTGVLWVGLSRAGFAQYHPETESFTHYNHDPNNPNSLSSDGVLQIIEDSKGDLWIATGHGLNHYQRQSGIFTRYYHDPQNPDSLSHSRLYSVLEDSQGFIWVGTRNHGLNRLNRKTGKFTRYQHQPGNPGSLSHNRVFTLAQTSDGSIWVGTRGGGLNRFDYNTGLFEHYRHDPDDPRSLSSDHVYAIVVEEDLSLWVGTRNGGLNRFDSKNRRFERYLHDPQNNRSLPDNDVLSIAKDNNGLLWLGTFGGGISQFNPASARFGLMQHNANDSNSLVKGDVNAILQDHQGLIWIGTTNGLNRYDETTDQFLHYQHDSDDPQSLSNNDVRSLGIDASGAIWVGTSQGLDRLNPSGNGFIRYRYQANDDSSLSDSEIDDIHLDQQGTMWFGTVAGLNRFNPESDSFTRYQFAADDVHSISHGSILTLYSAQDGSLWVGTKGGLNHLDPQQQRFKRYRHNPDDSNSLSHDTVYSITQDSQGIFWIGTRGGLDKFNPINGKFSHYTTKDGLNNNRVQAVLWSKNNQLWIGERGISMFDPVTERIITSIGSEANCQGAAYGSYFQADDGRLFFAGHYGYCAFLPEQAFIATQPPIIALTDFRLLNKSVPIRDLERSSVLSKTINHTQSLTLGHKDNVLSFEFAALHYTEPSQNQYQYKLIGFNPDWIETSSDNRRATYTNLSAGDYTFVVKASNNQGIWNEQGREIKLTILPAPWHTWWARSLYLLAALTIVGLFGYQRITKQRAIDERNEQLSLALWGSGDQLWDWDEKRGTLERRNILSHFNFASSESLLAMGDLLILLHPDDQADFQSALAAHLRGEKDYFEASYRLKDKSGEWRWVLDRGKIVDKDEQGRIKRFTGTLQDVHNSWLAKEALRELNETLEQKVKQRTQALQDSLDQLKAAQQQLVEAEKMAALGNLVAGVAHEVNTPLGICITSVSLHIEKLKKLSQQKATGTMTRRSLDQYLETTAQSQALVENNLHRAAELIQSFKKVAVEQTQDSFGEINFHDYLGDIIRSMEPRLKGKQITIELLSSGDWVINSWPGAWWQLLSNLVENSLSHGFWHRASGEITISAELDQLQPDQLQPDQQRLRFIYRDNGNGMTALQLEKMYEPFFTTARSRGATGLGMHIVFNLVAQKLGGTIKCQSQPDQGVTFTIAVPMGN